MASYDQNFNQMQEEALARLREMQRRSRTAVNRPRPNPPPPPQNDNHHHNHNQNQEHVHNHEPPHGGNRQQPSPPPSKSSPQDIIKSILGDVKIDSEKALILMMLYVLYKNKTDMKLLLALGYLLI